MTIHYIGEYGLKLEREKPMAIIPNYTPPPPPPFESKEREISEGIPSPCGVYKCVQTLKPTPGELIVGGDSTRRSSLSWSLRPGKNDRGAWVNLTPAYYTKEEIDKIIGILQEIKLFV